MRILEILFWSVIAFIAGYIILLVLLYLVQSKMMYYPSRDVGATPRNIGLEFENIFFRLDSGEKLHGWYVPNDTSGFTILFFHGNAGNISGRLDTIKLLYELGLNVCIIDYPGYGRSEGTPSEESTYKSGIEAYRYLVNQRDISPHKIILMGRSLGGPIAANIAASEPVAGLILESTFTTAAELATELYPVLPVRRIIQFRYPTIDFLQKVGKPVLITHSIDDDLIPFHHGEKLFKSAQEPKSFFRMTGRHGTGHLASGRAYKEAMLHFIRTVNSEYKKPVAPGDTTGQ